MHRKLLIIPAAAFLLVTVMAGLVHAQETASASGELLTLDQAIEMAMQKNHAIKIREFSVTQADENIFAAKTRRLPEIYLYSLLTTNLANSDTKVPNPEANQNPALGPFFLLTSKRQLSFAFGSTVVQPLTQQYRIGLQINAERVGRELAQAKLQQERNETIDEVKKTYYAILQTKSAVRSVREAVRSYEELNKVTGDYVMQQVALKADHLVVQTRLAKAQYDELELRSQLATQKEKLNTLLGRGVGYEFDVIDAPSFISIDTDLPTARKTALENRPELRQAKLNVDEAKLSRRIKKSEYIPDVSAGFAYLTPRNFQSGLPREYANVGIAVKWEVFDWNRKKHELAAIDNTIEQAKDDLKQTEDKVLVDVGDKLRKLQLTGQALKVAKLAEDSAKETLRVTTGQYKLQAAMLSDVLKNQASLAESTHDYQRALLSFWTAKAEYEKALGENK